MLDQKCREFIQSGVSISLAACDGDRLPCMSRGFGCRAGEDGEITVFIRRSQSQEVLAGIRHNGKVANVFSLPSSNRTLQLKGTDARLVALEAPDLAIIERHIADFTREVVPLGTPEALVRALFSYTRDDLVGVRYTPLAVYSQTPGPHAGEPVPSQP